MKRNTHRLRFIGSVCVLIVVVMIIGYWLCAVNMVTAQAPQLALPPQIQLDVTPAFKGHFKYGEWLPVQIEISNSGPDIRAEIQIPISGAGGTTVYATPVELPTGGRKRFVVFVLPNNFSRQINVELVADKVLLSSQKVDVHPNPNVNFLVAIASSERSALSLISNIKSPGIERKKVLVDFALSEIPTKPEGIRSFDLLIINDRDTSNLTPEQSKTLESWVMRGGKLIIGGGSGAQITVSGLPKLLFPALIEDTIELNTLDALENYAGEEKPIRVPGPFIVARILTDTGRSLILQDQTALLTEWSVGKGAVDFIALNPAAAPFDAWSGTTMFWQNLLSVSAAYPEWLPTDISSRQQFASNMPYSLSNLPMLELPSANWLAIMLAIYIILVGPVNYLVLRHLKRLDLAWISIPVITIVFSIASFLLGYALHGADIFVNKISIVQLEIDGSAHVDSYFGVFSPAQSTYEVEVFDAGLINPMTPFYDPWNSFNSPGNIQSGRNLILIQGNPSYVRGLSIDQWSMQSFMSEGTIENLGSISASLYIDNDQLIGLIHNSTQFSFQDSFVIIGNRYARLDELAPDGETEIQIDLSSLGKPDFNSSLSYSMLETDLNSSGASGLRRQAEVKRSILENLFERTPPFISSSATGLSHAPVFVGWTDIAQPGVKILGSTPAQGTTALVLTPLSFSILHLSKTNTISLPPGLVPGRLTSIPQDGGSCGTAGATAVYISRGKALFEFNMPLEIHEIEVQNFKLAVWTDSGFFSTPQVEFFNWNISEWVKLAGINQGVNLVPSATQFIRPDGMVQMRIAADGAQSCYYLALGLEGLIP